MLITSWNCNASPRTRLAATAAGIYQNKVSCISALASDITVLQEIPSPHVLNSPHAYWHGNAISRGIGVLTSADYTIEPLPGIPPSRSLLPLWINGPTNFVLLAVWSCPEKPSMQSYVTEVATDLDRCREVIAAFPTVIVGDFNSNSRWDDQLGSINHSRLTESLIASGLKSCYHSYFDLPQGQECLHTFYSYRHIDKHYHIDYCFVPAAWPIKTVKVGAHAEWSSQSDHCPLTVDIGYSR